jgi:hypothetical protein
VGNPALIALEGAAPMVIQMQRSELASRRQRTGQAALAAARPADNVQTHLERIADEALSPT